MFGTLLLLLGVTSFISTNLCVFCKDSQIFEISYFGVSNSFRTFFKGSPLITYVKSLSNLIPCTYLLPSLPQTNFAQAFEESVTISSERFNAAIPFPIVWKTKKLLNIGSEKWLRIAISKVREFAKNIIREK